MSGAADEATRCYGRSAFPIDHPLPPILLLADLAAILDLQHSRAKELENAGEFARFELKPRIGNRARYAGRKFQRWIEGEDLSDDADRSRHYFGSARLAKAAAGKP